MPTSLPRVQVTFTQETHEAIKKIAAANKVSLSKAVVELVHQALKKSKKGIL